MPELPEVEMVTRHLRALLVCRTVVKAQLRWPRLAPEHSPRQFAAWLKGAQVESVERRGKYILTNFDNRRTLLTHLRMTGRFLYVEEHTAAPPHTHALFWLENGRKLLFNDVRKFGKMHIARTDRLHELTQIAQLAPEPFSAEFSPAYLF